MRYSTSKCRDLGDLEYPVRGPSRSLKVSPFDRAHTTSYWRSIVTMIRRGKGLTPSDVNPSVAIAGSQQIALYQIFEYMTYLTSKCRDLENPVRGPSRSLKMSPFDRAHMTTYYRFITFHISYHFRDRRRFQSEIARFPHPLVFCAPR